MIAVSVTVLMKKTYVQPHKFSDRVPPQYYTINTVNKKGANQTAHVQLG